MTNFYRKTGVVIKTRPLLFGPLLKNKLGPKAGQAQFLKVVGPLLEIVGSWVAVGYGRKNGFLAHFWSFWPTLGPLLKIKPGQKILRKMAKNSLKQGKYGHF